MTNEYTLYGAPLSLYTGKIRSYLTFKQIPYQEVFSSLKVYKNIIIPNTGVRFIPVLKTPSNEYIQDTADMMDMLEQRFPQSSVVPFGPKQKLVSALMEMWGDEWLLIPAMHYRWNHDNFPFIYEEFGKVVLPSMPKFVRAFVGKKVGAKFKGFVPMLGITQNTIPAIENWYETHVLPLLDAHFKTHDYLLGSRPCVGDFGLMGPLYAHLFRDPAPGKLMQEIAPNVVKWIERMNAVPETEMASWDTDDEIPYTLNELIRRQFDEFWPVLASTLKHTQEWIEQNPDTQTLPRVIGEHHFTIGDTTGVRKVGTFSQWKLQRVLDLYAAFDDIEKSSVDAMLKDLGGYEFMQCAIKHRVMRQNNVLVVDKS